MLLYIVKQITEVMDKAMFRYDKLDVTCKIQSQFQPTLIFYILIHIILIQHYIHYCIHEHKQSRLCSEIIFYVVFVRMAQLIYTALFNIWLIQTLLKAQTDFTEQGFGTVILLQISCEFLMKINITHSLQSVPL